MKRYVYQWAVMAAALILAGLSFPAMFWRDDERHMLADNFGLDALDADGELSDGVEEAFGRVAQPGRLLHDIKNVGFEAFKARPKVWFKFSCFLIVVLLASHLF